VCVKIKELSVKSRGTANRRGEGRKQIRLKKRGFCRKRFDGGKRFLKTKAMDVQEKKKFGFSGGAPGGLRGSSTGNKTFEGTSQKKRDHRRKLR